MQGFDANQITIAAIAHRGRVRGGAASTGAIGSRSCAGRRSSCTASSAALVLVAAAALVSTTRPTCHVLVPIVGVVAAGVGLFVLAGATPAALGLLADMSERFPCRPRRDHGPLLGLPGDRPDHRQHHRRLRGRVARDRRDAARDAPAAGHRGAAARAAARPGARDRRGPGGPPPARPGRDRRRRPTRRRALGAGPARSRLARRGRRPASPRVCGRTGDAAGRRLGGRCRDRDQRGPGRRDAEQLRDRRRCVLADLGRGRGPAGRAQRVGTGARGG